MQQSSDAMPWSEGAAALLTFGILMFLEWSKIFKPRVIHGQHLSPAGSPYPKEALRVNPRHNFRYICGCVSRPSPRVNPVSRLALCPVG
jgi:hypothetical protein